MLSIGTLSGNTRNGRYYIDRVAQGREDYYVGAGEADGEWDGGGAELLGLQGNVGGDQLATLLEGRAPGSEIKLRRAPGPDATTGFDLTFSAPKSVSVLYAVGDEELSRAVREGHDAAVRAALGHLEREACRARRGPAGIKRVVGDGFVAALFRHRTSRAGDPQLHTHAVIANTTRAGGRWSALDSRALYREAQTAGYLYQAALRAELTGRLGVEWGPVSRGSADIVGVPHAVVREFSRRRVEIVRRMEERGESSRAAAQIAALDTRRRKDYGVPVDRLRADWRARAAEHGFDAAALGRVLDAARPERAARELATAAGEATGPEGICREHSTFDRRAALRWWAQAHRHGATPGTIRQMADDWLRSPAVVALSDPDREQAGEPDSELSYSTPEMLAVEQRLVDQAVARRAEGTGVVAREHVDRALAERPTITEEQAAVVRSLTDRKALAALRDGDIDAWADAYRRHGRIVARPNAGQLRDQLVRDWWQAARRGGVERALMLAHRRADVRDLNDRARAVMHDAGRLGDEELAVGDRRFAVGDRVLATRNDRRLRLTNGQRGTVEQLDAEQRALTITLDNGSSALVDAGYLEHGHLDHGYAATVHKAQGATVDAAFALGSDDLYREWGYTVLTRHRDEARFYVVAATSHDRPLPGLEPERDRLAERLRRTLGQSRAKSLAIDLADPAAVDRNDELREVLDRHDLLRNERDETGQAQGRARTELEDVEARLYELRAERDSLRFWQRERRSALDQHIAGHERAAEHWRQRSAELADAGDLADERLTTFVEAHGERRAEIAEREFDPLADGAPPKPDIDFDFARPAPLDDPDVGLDLGP